MIREIETAAAAIVLAGALAFGATSARATILIDCDGDSVFVAGASCTLTELAAGGEIKVNDKLFRDWVATPDASTTVSTPVITITGLDDGGLDPGPGLRYDFNPVLDVNFDEFSASPLITSSRPIPVP